MGSDKENNTNDSSGPGPSPRTKLANSANALSLRDSDDSLVETNNPEPATHDGLDRVVTGGCSTCGSAQHDTVKCESKDPPPDLMMSGALQTGTDVSAVWRARDSLTGPGQRPGRRNSV